MSQQLKVDTRVTVETPEGVDFQFLIAGPGKRGTAFFVDSILKVGVIFIVLLIGSATDGGRSAGVGVGLSLLVWFAMSWLYGSCCEAFLNGQTLGKKSQNLRVVRTNGTPIGWFEAFGRNLLLVADCFLFIPVFQAIQIPLCTVGLTSMAGTRRMQRLGDLIFDTMVIDETREFISRAPGITHGVETLPRADCTGRYFVPERTLAVIERLFEGDRLISDGRREEIAKNLSTTLRKWLGYEEPGPDPGNPNTFFTHVPTKHTVFLKRVLKTFADDADGTTEAAAFEGRDHDRYKPRHSAVNPAESTMEKPAATDTAATHGLKEEAVGVLSPSTGQADEPDLGALLNPDEPSAGRGLPSDWRKQQ